MKTAFRRLPRWCRATLALLVGCVLAGVASELLLRWLLFGSGDLARSLGRPWRHAAQWSFGIDDVDYWKLQTLFDAEKARPVHGMHPVLGWIGDVEPRTFAHRDEDALRGRRPVLLFGDSFSQCATPYADCWQGLLERSELSQDLALLNYGVGGYGLDQIALLCERVVPRFAERSPIVVVAVLVDDDVERCFLAFRGDPKPRFRLVEGELVLEPSGPRTRLEWVEEHPPSIPSYFGRLLGRTLGGGDEDAPRRFDAREAAERLALVDAILDRIRDALAAHGIRDWFVLLFHGEGSLADLPRALWQEDVVASYCRRNDIRCVSSRPYLEAAIAAGVPAHGLFVNAASSSRGHYSAAGNLVAMGALLQGIRGLPEPEPSGLRELLESGALARAGAYRDDFAIQGRPGEVRASAEVHCVRVRRSPDGSERLALRADDLGATEVELSLDGALTLTARARAIRQPGSTDGSGPPLVLSWRDSGGAERSQAFAVDAPEIPFTIADLDGDTLKARIERPGGDPRGAWLLLDDVRFRDGAR